MNENTCQVCGGDFAKYDHDECAESLSRRLREAGTLLRDFKQAWPGGYPVPVELFRRIEAQHG